MNFCIYWLCGVWSTAFSQWTCCRCWHWFCWCPVRLRVVFSVNVSWRSNWRRLRFRWFGPWETKQPWTNSSLDVSNSFCSKNDQKITTLWINVYNVIHMKSPTGKIVTFFSEMGLKIAKKISVPNRHTKYWLRKRPKFAIFTENLSNPIHIFICKCPPNYFLLFLSVVCNVENISGFNTSLVTSVQIKQDEIRPPFQIPPKPPAKEDDDEKLEEEQIIPVQPQSHPKGRHGRSVPEGKTFEKQGAKELFWTWHHDLFPEKAPAGSSGSGSKATSEEDSSGDRSEEEEREDVIAWKLLGIFQLSDRVACDSGLSGSLNLCGLECSGEWRTNITYPTLLNKYIYICLSVFLLPWQLSLMMTSLMTSLAWRLWREAAANCKFHTCKSKCANAHTISFRFNPNILFLAVASIPRRDSWLRCEYEHRNCSCDWPPALSSSTCVFMCFRLAMVLVKECRSVVPSKYFAECA